METLAEGTVLHGRYTTKAVLGIGGFGITYEGRDNILGRKVAIKELFLNGSNRQGLGVTNPPGYSTERWSKSITSFLQEARTLAGIDDPSMVAVYDYFDENNTAYMVMKFIEGVTLDKYMLARNGPLSEAEALGFTRQIGDALVLLHAANILHRDVKPSNVIITPSGRAVLIDFGSAREFAVDRTMQQTAVATMGFAPPEQYHAFARKGTYTDVYALAATCYYMLTGEPPGSEVSPLVARSPLMPVLMHALAFNSNERTSNVPAFLAELRDPALVPPAYAALLDEQYPSNDEVSRFSGAATAPTQEDAGGNTPLAPPSTPATTNTGNRLDDRMTSILPEYKRQPPVARAVPNSGLALPPMPVPPIAPSAQPAPPIAPVPPATRRSSRLLAAVAAIGVIAAVTVAAFVLLNGGASPNPNSIAIVPSPTAVSSPTVFASPTQLIALVISPTPTYLPASPTPTLAATDTPTALPPPTATPLLPTATPLLPFVMPPATAPPPTSVPPPPPSATRVPPPLPSATRVPPSPPTDTPKPKPTITPVPPTNTSVPTSTPLPLPTNTPMPTGCNKQGRAVNGLYVDGEFYFFWCTNGDGAVFGNPISEVSTAANYPDVSRYQWFEFARLEWHPSYSGGNGAVSTGALGVEDMRLHGYSDTNPHFVRTTASGDGIYFPQTGHNLAHGFYQRWSAYGGQSVGVALFGYPISEEFNEGGIIVQYFQRAVFEVRNGVEQRALGHELMP